MHGVDCRKVIVAAVAIARYLTSHLDSLSVWCPKCLAAMNTSRGYRIPSVDLIHAFRKIRVLLTEHPCFDLTCNTYHSSS